MFSRRAARRARLREIFAHQDGVEIRHISPPDYQEVALPPPEPHPPSYREVAEDIASLTTERSSPNISVVEAHSEQAVPVILDSRIRNENRELIDPGGGVGFEAMPSNDETDATVVSSDGGRLRDFQDRFEAMRKRNANFTCFLCCHVRTGTIIIGFWHMLLQLVALSLIAIAIMHPNLLVASGNLSADAQADKNDQLSVHHQDVHDVQALDCGDETPCILAAQGDTPGYQSPSDMSFGLENFLTVPHRLNGDEVTVAFIITLSTFLVTLLLVYGAFRGHPSHLIPFFFLQVFDFCVSSLSMVGYLTYLPQVRQKIRQFPAIPFQQQLLAMNTNCLTFVVMVFSITTLMGKGYCISIVWRCYKFLMLKAQAGQSVLRYLGSVSAPVDQESQTLVVGHDVHDCDSAMGDPQHRKKILSLYPEPPPSYDAAMAALVSQQHEFSRRNPDIVDAIVRDLPGEPCPSYGQSTMGQLSSATHLDGATSVNMSANGILPTSSTVIPTPNSSNSQQ